MEAFTIGQLARHAGVPVTTVRFYERTGLLRPDFRTGANYRGYSQASLERLRFIGAAKEIGLTLADITQLLGMPAEASAPCAEVLELMRTRLTAVRVRIDALHQVEGVLTRALETCCKPGGRDWCKDLERLSDSRVTRARKKSTRPA